MMEYKFREGDKVRLAKGTRLARISMAGKRPPELKGEFEVTKATPGTEGWRDKKLSGQPTYSVSGGWRIPESFLVDSP